MRLPATDSIFKDRPIGSGRPKRETRSTVPGYGAGPAKVAP
jgi:hypothetical protein